MNNRTQWFITGAFAILLTACATPQPQSNIVPFDVRDTLAEDIAQSQTNAELDNAEIVQVPDTLTDELLALDKAPGVAKRFNIESRDRPAAQFFSDLGRSQNINLLVDPTISGSITLSLREVTIEQTFSALRDLYGYDFKRTSYGYKVAPNQISTRVYRLNYLNIQRTGSSQTRLGGDENNTVTTSFSANADSASGNFWSSIRDSVLGFISDSEVDNAVIVNEQTGLLVISANNKEHAEITRFLQDAELIMQKQVIIEAKIVEVTLDHEYRSGINWSFFNDNFGTSGTSAGLGIGGNPLAGAGDGGGLFNLSLSLDNFSSMLQLLDYQGDVQVLSSPRVSTVNNQKAVIKVGTDEYFATVSSVETGEDGALAPAFEMAQFFSGIALDVTPQISQDNSVILHVRPSVTDVVEKTKVLSIAGQNYSLPLAYSNIRESDSIIRATSGQIVVIGGLLQQKQNFNDSGLPTLNKLPLFGKLFNQERQEQVKSELIILLKPTVFDEFTSMDDVSLVLDRLE